MPSKIVVRKDDGLDLITRDAIVSIVITMAAIADIYRFSFATPTSPRIRKKIVDPSTARVATRRLVKSASVSLMLLGRRDSSGGGVDAEEFLMYSSVTAVGMITIRLVMSMSNNATRVYFKDRKKQD